MANILSVDDSASMRQMVSFTLKGDGHNVIDAADGKQALDLAAKQKFDLVLTDVNMPMMDGLALTKEFANCPLTGLPPILVLTTEAGSDKKQAGRQAGASGWLVKPFNPDRLLKTVAKVLG